MRIKDRRYIICKQCRERWNVPKGIDYMARGGYICPHCVAKNKISKEAKQYEERNA